MNILKILLFINCTFLLITCKTDSPSISNSITNSIPTPIGQKGFCEINNDIDATGDPHKIDIPTHSKDIYGKEAPTYFELNGINVNKGNEYHFKEMPRLSESFSHARTFHYMNKDYWDDNLGQANYHDPATLRKNDPKETHRLKLLVDAQGVPIVRNQVQPGDKLIYFDAEHEVLMEENLKPGFFNVYENYLNQNWMYQKSVSDKFNGRLAMTLTTIGGNFPKDVQDRYGFPYQWFRDEDWGEDIRLSAKAYAMMFARAYAPKDGSYQVCEILEIGNEPWGLKAATYQKIVDGFVEGFQDYYGDDFLIKLLPAAFQAHHKENSNKPTYLRADWKDYLGTRLNTASKCKLDGINIHNYSCDLDDRQFNGWFKERLIAAPDQSSSAFLYARNAWKWTQQNMPANARNIYASEYGWDTRDDCEKDVNATAVGPEAQGLYVVRSILMYSRLGVTRANVFELLDDQGQDPCQLAFHSAGFYGLKNNIAFPKASVGIVHDFIKMVGHLRFNQVLVEHNDYLIFELTDGEKNYRLGWTTANVNNKTMQEILSMTKKVTFESEKYTLLPVPQLLD